jgi:hypothetical protein
MKQVYDHIEAAEGAVAAGIISIKVAPREWIASIVTDTVTGIVTAVNFISGKNWIIIEFTPASYDFDEKQKENKSGTYYDTKLSGILNTFSADVQLVLETLRYHEVIAAVKDRNRKTKLAGNTTTALRFSYSDKTENKGSGDQTVEVEMNAELEELSPFFQE